MANNHFIFGTAFDNRFYVEHNIRLCSVENGTIVIHKAISNKGSGRVIQLASLLNNQIAILDLNNIKIIDINSDNQVKQINRVEGQFTNTAILSNGNLITTSISTYRPINVSLSLIIL